MKLCSEFNSVHSVVVKMFNQHKQSSSRCQQRKQAQGLQWVVSSGDHEQLTHCPYSQLAKRLSNLNVSPWTVGKCVGIFTLPRLNVQSHSLSLSPLLPDGQMCQRERGRTASVQWRACLVRIYHVCLHLRGFVNSKHQKIKRFLQDVQMVVVLDDWALINIACCCAATCPILWDTPAFIQMIRWCESQKHTALFHLYFPTRLQAKCGFGEKLKST